MKDLKQHTRLALENAAYCPKKLSLIYAAVGAGTTLLLSVIGYFLDQGIAGTGGLDGMGLRAVLSTAQTLLMLISTVLLPFWDHGFLFAGIRLARQEQVGPKALLEGFRRFRPVLRLMIFKTLLIWGVLMGCMYGGYAIFMLSPFFTGVAELLTPVLEAGNSVLDYSAIEALMPQLLPKLVPLFIILAGVFLVFGVPLLYRYRQAEFLVMDGQTGALKCIGLSTRMMKGQRLELLKLDLSFWWYYLLQLALTAVAYGDSILPLLGIRLPLSSTAAYWVFYLVYFLLRLAVAYGFGAYIQTAYAGFYDTIRPQENT